MPHRSHCRVRRNQVCTAPWGKQRISAALHESVPAEPDALASATLKSCSDHSDQEAARVAAIASGVGLSTWRCSAQTRCQCLLILSVTSWLSKASPRSSKTTTPAGSWSLPRSHRERPWSDGSLSRLRHSVQFSASETSPTTRESPV